MIFASWQNLLVASSRSPEAPGTFELLERHATHMSLRHPSGFGYLVIVQHEDRPPPGYVETMGRITREFGVMLRAGGAVFEAKGFAAATQRSVGTALIHAVGKAKQIKLFSSVDEAAPWLAKQLGETCPGARDAGALLAALEAVRARPAPLAG
ncbi:MAG: hypothetical protein H5U40_18355 [Polyangiaceae bacterium]|nr:hypothetical protein [Polyangiaceae bacterium]